MVKVCSKCGIEKSVSEFGKFVHSKDGLKPHCKPCRVITSKEYYQKNRSEIREKVRVANEANPEPNRRRVRVWQNENPQKVKEQKVVIRHRRRARVRGNSFSAYLFQDVLNLYGSMCHLCDEEVDLSAPRRVGVKGWERGLHIDHVIPIACGGADNLENVRPSHARCNVDKGKKLITKESK